MQKCTHTHTQTDTHMCTPIDKHTYTHKQFHTYTHIPKTPKQPHTHTRTYLKHTQALTPPSLQSPLSALLCLHWAWRVAMCVLSGGGCPSLPRLSQGERPGPAAAGAVAPAAVPAFLKAKQYGLSSVCFRLSFAAAGAHTCSPGVASLFWTFCFLGVFLSPELQQPQQSSSA